jgi:hypothetical protein
VVYPIVYKVLHTFIYAYLSLKTDFCEGKIKYLLSEILLAKVLQDGLVLLQH